MGNCLQHFFSSKIQQPLQLLQKTQQLTKINTYLTTANDNQFSYYKKYYELQKLLNDVLKTYQKSENNSEIVAQIEKKYASQIHIQELQLQKYVKEYNDETSSLFNKIKKTQTQLAKNSLINNIKGATSQQDLCLIKLQIQEISQRSQIAHLSISIFNSSSQLYNKTLSSINIQLQHQNQIKKKQLFTYLQIQAPKNSKIIFSTSPLQSSLTLDVSDIIESIVILDIFNLKNQMKNIAKVSLRIEGILMGQLQRRKVIQFFGLKKYQLARLLKGHGRGWSGLFSEKNGTLSDNQKQQSLMSYYDNPYIV